MSNFTCLWYGMLPRARFQVHGFSRVDINNVTCFATKYFIQSSFGIVPCTENIYIQGLEWLQHMQWIAKSYPFAGHWTFMSRQSLKVTQLSPTSYPFDTLSLSLVSRAVWDLIFFLSTSCLLELIFKIKCRVLLLRSRQCKLFVSEY